MEQRASINKIPSYVWTFGARQILLAPKEHLKEKVKMEDRKSLFHAVNANDWYEMELYVHLTIPFYFLTLDFRTRQHVDSAISQWELTFQNPIGPASILLLSAKIATWSIIAFQSINRIYITFHPLFPFANPAHICAALLVTHFAASNSTLNAVFFEFVGSESWYPLATPSGLDVEGSSAVWNWKYTCLVSFPLGWGRILLRFGRVSGIAIMRSCRDIDIRKSIGSRPDSPLVKFKEQYLIWRSR